MTKFFKNDDELKQIPEKNPSLETKVLQKMLPIFKKGYEEERRRLTAIFEQLITSADEPTDFFVSPISYLKKMDLLSLDVIDLPNGEKVPLYDDEQMRKAVTTARKQYHLTKEIDSKVLNAPVLVALTQVLVVVGYVVAVIAAIPVLGLDVKKLDFGPLMSPESSKKLKAAVADVLEQKSIPQQPKI